MEIKTDEELRKYDKKRKDKKVSNDEWTSPADPDSRIAKMKDVRTHLAYKAEHTVDLESEFILDASVYQADEGDGETLLKSITSAQQNLERSRRCIGTSKRWPRTRAITRTRRWPTVRRVGVLSACERTFPNPDSPYERRWTDKPSEYERAYRENRRRVKGNRGKRLQKKRSERVERSFAHVCETGGARRTWLRGLEKINKRYKMQTAARNLGLLMRALFGVGKPRCLQGGSSFVYSLQVVTKALKFAVCGLDRFQPPIPSPRAILSPATAAV